MNKPKAWTKEWNKDRQEARETLTCQTLILEFLHFTAEHYDTVAPATQKTVQEFRNYLEEKKNKLRKKGQQFEEKIETDKERVDNEIKYNREKRGKPFIKWGNI